MIFNHRLGACSKYESLWSRIHKFSYLNGASHTDLKILLNRYKVGSFKRATENFDSLDEFKIDVLYEILGMGEENLYLGIPSTYQIDYRSRSVAGNLRYCPVCISKGFHSAAFQVGCIKKCPLHNIEFSDRCPSCNSLVEYRYGDKELKTPYGCACGFTLWDGLFDTDWERSISVEQEDTFKCYLDRKSESQLYNSHSNFIGSACVVPIEGWSPGCFGCQIDEVLTRTYSENYTINDQPNKCLLVNSVECSIKPGGLYGWDYKFLLTHQYGAYIEKIINNLIGAVKSHYQCSKGINFNKFGVSLLDGYCLWGGAVRYLKNIHEYESEISMLNGLVVDKYKLALSTIQGSDDLVGDFNGPLVHWLTKAILEANLHHDFGKGLWEMISPVNVAQNIKALPVGSVSIHSLPPTIWYWPATANSPPIVKSHAGISLSNIKSLASIESMGCHNNR